MITFLGLTPEAWGIWTSSGIAGTTGIAILFKWFGSAKLRETITDTIKESIPDISKIPELTLAVTKLTDALGTQSNDTKDLTNTIAALDGKIQRISDDMGTLRDRTATLEGAFPTVASTAEAAAKVVASAALAAEAAGKAAAEAAATVLRTALLAASQTSEPKTRKKRASRRK